VRERAKALEKEVKRLAGAVREKRKLATLVLLKCAVGIEWNAIGLTLLKIMVGFKRPLWIERRFWQMKVAGDALSASQSREAAALAATHERDAASKQSSKADAGRRTTARREREALQVSLRLRPPI
jgi:hypothetical protein